MIEDSVEPVVLPPRAWPLGWSTPGRFSRWSPVAAALVGSVLAVYVLVRIAVADDGWETVLDAHDPRSVPLAMLMAALTLGYAGMFRPASPRVRLRAVKVRPRTSSRGGRATTVVPGGPGWGVPTSVSRVGVLCAAIAVATVVWVAGTRPEHGSLIGWGVVVAAVALTVLSSRTRIVLTPEHVLYESVSGCGAVAWEDVVGVDAGETRQQAGPPQRYVRVRARSREVMTGSWASGVTAGPPGIVLSMTTVGADPILVHDVVQYFRRHPEQRHRLAGPPAVRRAVG